MAQAKDMLEALDPSHCFDFKNNMIWLDGGPIHGRVDLLCLLPGWSEFIERLGFDPLEHPELRVLRMPRDSAEQKQIPYGTRYIGFMADDAEKVMPEAVSMHPEGYRQVNYDMLIHGMLNHGFPLQLYTWRYK